MPIEEIGQEEVSPASKVKVTEKLQEKLKVIAKEEEKFDHFLTPGQICSREQSGQKQKDLVQEISDVSLAEESFKDLKDDGASELKLNLNGVVAQNDSDSPAKRGSETSSHSTSPRVPPEPISSFQFQTDCKALRQAPEQFYQYFKVMSYLVREMLKLVSHLDNITQQLYILFCTPGNLE